jgi:hypothetical protein
VWTPVSRSKDLVGGKPLGVDFWGARLELTRQADGAIRVSSMLHVREAWGLVWVGLEPEQLRPFPTFGAPAEASVICDSVRIGGAFTTWLDHQIDAVHMFFPHARSIFGLRPAAIDAPDSAVTITSASIDREWRGSIAVSNLPSLPWSIRIMQAGGPLRAGLLAIRAWLGVARHTPESVEMCAEMLSPTMQKLDLVYSGPFGSKRITYVTILNPVREGCTEMTFVIFLHAPMRGLLGGLELRSAAARATRMHITGEDHDFLASTAETPFEDLALSKHDAFVAYHRWNLGRYLDACSDLFPAASIAPRIARSLGGAAVMPSPPAGNLAAGGSATVQALEPMSLPTSQSAPTLAATALS